jgi:hypothetical protein
VLLSKTSRTIVRDPRKARVPSVRTPDVPAEMGQQSQQFDLQQQQQRQGLPFEPTQQNQQSVGSSLASYGLAGAGMAIGFSIVGALFGGF